MIDVTLVNVWRIYARSVTNTSREFLALPHFPSLRACAPTHGGAFHWLHIRFFGGQQWLAFLLLNGFRLHLALRSSNLYLLLEHKTMHGK